MTPRIWNWQCGEAAVLATFDRKLAEAARAAGVRVFGDAV
jgi:rRNA-processing protein FCF1